MKFVLAVLALVALASAAPLLQLSEDADVLEGSYIVVMHDHVSVAERDAHLSSVRQLFADHMDFSVQHKYNHALNGFAAQMSERVVQHHLSSPLVKYVEPDQMMHAMPFHQGNMANVDMHMSAPAPVSDKPAAAACTVQSGATWGISRVSQTRTQFNDANNDQKFHHQTFSGNTPVDIYILDTGIYTQNNDFGGRASFSFKASSFWSDSDANGHGTHVASTAGGTTYGICRNSRLLAVKVLGDNGSGSNSGVIAGVDHVAGKASSSARRVVGNMSLGGGASSALDAACNGAVTNGVVMVVAAGNENRNACLGSPARAADVMTVMSTTQGTSVDTRSSFSNYGSCGDVFAPGSSITAAWINGVNAVNTISGTSMASPHVAGIAGQLVHQSSTGTSAEAIMQAILASSEDGIVSSAGSGSPNKFAQDLCA